MRQSNLLLSYVLSSAFFQWRIESASLCLMLLGEKEDDNQQEERSQQDRIRTYIPSLPTEEVILINGLPHL